MRGRLYRRPIRHAFVPDELLAELPIPKPRAETKRQRANRFQAMLDAGEARSRAELARLLGCSRAWVTRVLGAQPTRR